MRLLLLSIAVASSALVDGQVNNVTFTGPEALQAMKGQHDPAQYTASNVIDDHAEIICALRTAVNADSLRAHLERITSFGTRHTYSDTLSETTGIGAARRWAFNRFQQWGAENDGRLLPAYVRFDYTNETGNCGSGQDWRDVVAVLPGAGTVDHRIVLLEAHLDSRCTDNCDPACVAHGAEDNGSGCALVMELARVMSRFTFKHTLVFMLTTGEEHGLLGAQAMADLCSQEGISIAAVLNNDIVGGILCGHTASPPGCGEVNEVDSLQFRIFSHSNARGLSRSIRLGYDEKLSEAVPVPMLISVMEREDRVGRGGDHIPFREAGWPSIRFTAANEHGDGDPAQDGYEDRQHTSDDLLGLDLNGDGTLDTLFVDFNYLARNAVINGMAATLMAHGPRPPTFNVLDEPTGLRAVITGLPEHVEYRVGVRSSQSTGYFDAVYRTNQSSFLIPNLVSPGVYFVSVAGIDAQGITSPFTAELVRTNDAATPQAPVDDLPYGLNCSPIGLNEGALPTNSLRVLLNPFTERTELKWEGVTLAHVELVIHDAEGRVVHHSAIPALGKGQLFGYAHSAGAGVFRCSLLSRGTRIASTNLIALD